MNFTFKDFFDFLKLPPNILFAVSLSTGLILFLPNTILTKMYLVEFKDKYGFFIGLTFVITISILFVFFVSYILKKIINKILEIKLKRKRTEYLLSADKTKIKLIKEFLREETHTLPLPANNGLILELQSYNVIGLAGGTQLVDTDYDNNIYVKYFLQPWVVEIITNNEDLKKIYKI